MFKQINLGPGPVSLASMAIGSRKQSRKENSVTDTMVLELHWVSGCTYKKCIQCEFILGKSIY
uniref:Uncharacterized protein n=1 Tax=Anguilla anguilla TaxID=7936 RepID=A0A0E9U592_ANGAN